MKNVIKNTLVKLVEKVKRYNMAQDMLLLDDHQLDDIGLSRYKLEQGSKAYPWKVEVTGEVKPVVIENLFVLETINVDFQGKADNDSSDCFDSPKAA